MILRHIYLSSGHNYVGRHGLGAENHGIVEAGQVECVAGYGLRGDRFFGHRPDFKGQVTLFSWEVFIALREAFPFPPLTPAALRRNLIVEQSELNALIGTEFQLQGVRLYGTEECRPCYWMDQAVGPGAEAWLAGRGGLRCRILSDGWLNQENAVAAQRS